MSNFDNAFTALIGSEGGYSNNPNDTGGETMWGITRRVAVANGYAGAMKDLPLSTAKSIAKTQYWDKVRGDDIDLRIAFQLFDILYNGGHPIQWLQQAIGVKADGVFGNVTLAAVKAMDVPETVMLINAYRLLYYTSLPTWNTFGKGWTNRVANNMIKAAS